MRWLRCTAGAGLGELQAGTVVVLQVAGRGRIPVDATTEMPNVTAMLPRAAGFITVFPCDERRPLASSLNFGPGVVVPNAVLAKVASGGTVCLYTSATTHLLVDVLAGA